MVVLRNINQDFEKKSISSILEDNISAEILFDICFDCHFLTKEMSSIPQGMYCAKKMRENEDKLAIAKMKKPDNFSSKKCFSPIPMELTPVKYNSKLMNSIWGFYNRYSPYNFKKTNEVLFKGIGDLPEHAVSIQKIAAVKESADSVAKLSLKTQPQNNASKMENIWTHIPISQSQ